MGRGKPPDDPVLRAADPHGLIPDVRSIQRRRRPSGRRFRFQTGKFKPAATRFRLPGDTADTTASAALTKWQALEDAPAPVDTSALADQHHAQDTPAHTDGWLL